MNKNKVMLKTLCAATLIALGTSAAHAERVIVQHDASQNGLKKGHQVLVEGNGWFAVDLDENGKSAMRGKKGFKNIQVDHKRFPMWEDSAGNPNSVQVTPYNYSQAQGDLLTLQAGMKVCVIDSGIAEMQGETGGKNNDFDFSVITGDNDSGTGFYNADGGAHGTHVAGTIGAVDNGFGIIGVAPGVPMHIIKVFNDAGYGYSSSLAKAVNLCGAAGANIINMSLGGGGANSTEENAIQNFVDNGGLVLVAAGNDGNTTRSYPAGYSASMMVGGVNKDDAKYAASQFPPCLTTTTGKGRNRTTVADEQTCVEISGGGEAVLSTVPSGTGASASLTVDGTSVSTASSSNTGNVTAATYFMGTAEATDAGANGNICIIDRGNISFSDKINNCANSGGVGAVVINNVAEEGPINMDITGVTTSIPAVGAALADRTTIVGAASATIESGAGDYAVFSGTSMATPTVAGAAALVWSNHPSCTGEEIRAALKASAQDIGPAGRDDDFGYGIVKAKDTSDYLTANGCDGGVVEPPVETTLSGNRSKGGRQANLSWSGLNGSNVDVYRDGSSSSTANDGSASYSVTKNVSVTFKVCETGSTVCTNEITL